jgi:hypothetical protein
MSVEDAGFNYYPRVRDVNFYYAIHTREADDNAARMRKRATAQTSARTARYEWNMLAVTDACNLLHLLARRR